MEQNLKKPPNPSKGLLQSDELYQYILETSVFPREPEPLKELREVTATHPRAMMATAPDAGQLITMLLSLVNAKKTIEIGVFTGYSLLLTALSIPQDGKNCYDTDTMLVQIVAIDISRESYEIGLPIIRKSGVEHKIDFNESEALPILDQLLEDSQNTASFDFAFVDADKVGGIVVYDNTLWGGTVAMPEELVPDYMQQGRELTIKLNKSLASDPRVQISHAPLGDGITICRRLY
ncbi:O-methyltransferase [Trema orientale]|uniref:O-methyltransferase n=1 Tax=Trema orientale TaxID=63057 RepID=A0A2P5FS69_TREOI|nr:O-methyltransferase [Trema orientale]